MIFRFSLVEIIELVFLRYASYSNIIPKLLPKFRLFSHYIFFLMTIFFSCILKLKWKQQKSRS